MNYNFEYHDVQASASLETFAKEKMDKLVNKYDFIVRADIFFKTENTSSDDTGKKCGIRLSAPGPRLFAESNSKNFHEAVAVCVKELDTQLHKRKDKMKSHY
ncbi:ribosome hibernation-promoting factor, HPF/YfiA family [Leeuwenhoekiella sp. A16]|uniref:ribosome hibernation-promoting factor, HPF/YfiA family n=1 Tax=unclassified Leeuwenhoekiella TaxID=2615029 RepID=UPI003A80CD13|tara:strand:- start:63 stop:368 length:306 start_codon:yes stop_codon:yes gene_type:complete